MQYNCKQSQLERTLTKSWVLLICSNSILLHCVKLSKSVWSWTYWSNWPTNTVITQLFKKDHSLSTTSQTEWSILDFTFHFLFHVHHKLPAITMPLKTWSRENVINDMCIIRIRIRWSCCNRCYSSCYLAAANSYYVFIHSPKKHHIWHRWFKWFPTAVPCNSAKLSSILACLTHRFYHQLCHFCKKK